MSTVTIRVTGATGNTISLSATGNHLAVDRAGNLRIYRKGRILSKHSATFMSGKWVAAWVDGNLVEKEGTADVPWRCDMNGDSWETDKAGNMKVWYQGRVVTVIRSGDWGHVSRNDIA